MNATPLTDFLMNNLPTMRELLAAAPPALAWTGVCLALAGWLKRYCHWKTGYTRKVFHFLVFGSAALVQSFWGLQSLCIFGASASAWILLAVFLGDGNLLYEALAREKDAPHRTHYILIPYLATLIGGVLSNAYFGSAAIAGYLVTGLADAIAEPVGTRFGKHTYRVPSLRSVKAIRSLEGSTAVFLASIPALIGACALSPALEPTLEHIPFIMTAALICTLTEAVAPHGWDNALLQLIPSVMIFYHTGGLL